jgi:hypothetical protein
MPALEENYRGTPLGRWPRAGALWQFVLLSLLICPVGGCGSGEGVHSDEGQEPAADVGRPPEDSPESHDEAGSDPTSGAGQPSAMPAERESVPGRGPAARLTDDLLDTSQILGCQPAWGEIDDPSKDGWDTEVFNQLAGKQLKAMGKLLTHPEQIAAEALEGLAVAGVHCTALRPAGARTVYEDSLLTVRRADVDAGRIMPQSPGRYRGVDGLAQALRELAQPLHDAEGVQFKFKIIRVLPAEDSVTTQQYFSISGRVKAGVREQNATWKIRWQAGAKPRIAWLAVTDFEEVIAHGSGGPLFADCTQAALQKDASYGQQLVWGCNHWLERVENTRDMALFGNPGMALGDVNGDGLEDVYLCQEQGLPNRLFVQQPDGTLRDQSRSSGVDWLEDSRSALLVDLDNDSDQDLVVSVIGNLLLAANDGRGRFTTQAVLPTNDDTMSISAVDYGRDGRLDLYVCGYNPDRELDKTGAAVFLSEAEQFVFHDANTGGCNSLFRSEISAGQPWRMTDVTRSVGLDANNRRYSFAATWEDFDNDGDQDLYVANDYGRDNLYRHDSGPDDRPRFVDIGDEAQAEDSAGGMSIAWGDYNRDGWMDAYVSNMFSSAGNRVTYQASFQPGAPAEVKRRLQHFARGNTLLANRAGGGFEDVSGPAGVEMGRWAWGSLFVDLNNDGWEDLFVANGYMTADDTGDL